MNIEFQTIVSRQTQLEARIKKIEDALIIHERNVDPLRKKLDDLVKLIQKNVI
jgi:hypothetical protein